MIPAGPLSTRAQELSAQGCVFVTATVVRAEHPTSVQPGNVALVHEDGSIEGFVGGVCAQNSVRLYSLKAIERGEPLLLRILPDGPDPAAGAKAKSGANADPGHEIAYDEGSVTVQNPCLSGGAIEVFLEPFLPAPRMIVAGDTPIAAALLRLGPELGLDAVAGSAHDTGSPVPGEDDLAVVVAAHGRDERAILRAALEADVRYVGLVASRKRGSAVLRSLRSDGVAEALLQRIDTPAGLDIGARTPAEIALSILASIIEVRRRSDAPRPAPADDAPADQAPTKQTPTEQTPTDQTPTEQTTTEQTTTDQTTTERTPTEQTPTHQTTTERTPTDRTPTRPATAADPICGMTVVVTLDALSATHAGDTHYFCGEGCLRAFGQLHASA